MAVPSFLAKNGAVNLNNPTKMVKLMGADGTRTFTANAGTLLTAVHCVLPAA